MNDRQVLTRLEEERAKMPPLPAAPGFRNSMFIPF